MAKLWGSRFDKASDKLADEFSFSIGYDYRLAKYDVQAGIAHARMLGACKIIPAADAKKLISGLTTILKKIEQGQFTFDPQVEDVHTHIQAELKKLIGDAADRLHTARSRNDLIVADMKLYCRDKLTGVRDLLTDLQKAIVNCAARYPKLIIPAYTHLQQAQVVLLAHQLLAYVEMLERDKGRLADAIKRMNVSPLGSGALSGTSLPVDRDAVSQALGFDAPAANSMDAVSDRDFLIEALSALAVVGTHASRMAEDMILWSTYEFGFADIDGSLCTGSSIMPHKKNPDMLELIRGESAGLAANLSQLLMLMKGLPLTYNRDLQLDKPPVFASVEKTEYILALLAKHYATIEFDDGLLEFDTGGEWFFSVDIMEYLIRQGLSYRDAHDTVGRLFRDSMEQGFDVADMDLKDLQKYSPMFGTDIQKQLTAPRSVAAKQSSGSTNPAMVRRQLNKWKKKLDA